MFKFNIGSAVNGVNNTLQRIDVLQAVYRAGFSDAEIIDIVDSATETTFVVVASNHRDWFGEGHEKAVHKLCVELKQDAIAYKALHTNGLVGYLVGPKAEDWGGEFNPEYFID